MTGIVRASFFRFLINSILAAFLTGGMISCAAGHGGANGTGSGAGLSSLNGGGSGGIDSLNGGGGAGGGGSSGSGAGGYNTSSLRKAAPSVAGANGQALSLSDLLGMWGDPAEYPALPPQNQIGVEFGMATVMANGATCSPLSGWSVHQQTVVSNGSGALSAVCLYNRIRADGFRAEYTITHAGSDGAAVYCGSQPPGGGWALKGGGCVYQGGGTCISDVCLWERSSTELNVVGISHAGGNATDDVDCRQTPPQVSSPVVLDGVVRQPLLSRTTNVYSDICLWQFRITE